VDRQPPTGCRSFGRSIGQDSARTLDHLASAASGPGRTPDTSNVRLLNVAEQHQPKEFNAKRPPPPVGHAEHGHARVAACASRLQEPYSFVR
jgi:hypothetical protein